MRSRLVLFAVAAMLASVAGVVPHVGGAPSASAAADTFGFMRFQTPVMTNFTNMFGGPRFPAGDELELPPGSLLSINIYDSTEAGLAQVHPCGQPLEAEWDFVFAAGQSLVRQVAVEQIPMCLQSTVPVHFLIARYGSVAKKRVPGAYQFVEDSVELVGPTSVESPVGGPGTPIRLTPMDPVGEYVFAIEATGNGEFFGSLMDCEAAWSDSPTPSFVASDTSTSTVAYRVFGDTDETCLRVWGSGTLRIHRLGELTKSASSTFFASLPPEALSRVEQLSAPGFTPSEPTRVLDTRRALGGPLGPVAANQVVRLDLGTAMSRGTTAVVLNVTATGGQADGFVTAYPCGQSVPDVSSLNFAASQDVANLVTVELGTNSAVCLVSSAATQLIVDYAGRYEQGGSLGAAVAPTRLLDTRSGVGAPVGRVARNSVVTLQVAGRATVPASGATAVTLNVTVTGAIEGGFVTAYPCDRPQPDASNINFVRGRDVPNLVTVKLSATGTVCLATSGTTHLLADLAMWFGEGGTSGFVDLPPTRVLDSRQTSLIGVGGLSRRIEANERLVRTPLDGLVASRTGGGDDGTLTLTASVPDVVDAVVMNVTVAGPLGEGFASLYPCDGAKPEASNLNFRRGADVANLTTTKVSPTNEVCFTPSAAGYILADVAGYFTSTTAQREIVLPVYDPS